MVTTRETNPGEEPPGAAASAESSCARALREIEVLIRARYPVIHISTWEEQRVERWLYQIAEARGKRLLTWSITAGLAEAGMNQSASRSRVSPTKDPIQALDEVISQVDPAIFLFKDLHPYLKNENVVRKLKEAAFSVKDSYKTIVMVSSNLEVPTELEKEITMVDFPLPQIEEFSQLLDRILEEVKDRPNVRIEVSPDAREQLLKAALGLTLTEAENVFAKIIVNDGRLTDADINAVYAEKKQIIRKSGLLDYYEPEVGFEHVGGLDLLKNWLRTRALAFTDRAREYGLPNPRGAFMLGIQGCGKSLCAKAVSSLWRMPLLRLDVGRMFGSLVGSSEENMRNALRVAESVAPAVLWLDEIDKAMAGSASSGSTDGGTTSRVFGTFLTWLSEKTSPVFVIATANDISALPPELMRKGRFDEIFFVDLPNDEEREKIFAIHLQRRKRNAEAYNLKALADAAVGFSGAEIEEAVVSAMYDAFAENVEVTDEHILKAVRETVPLSRTMESELDRLRGWAEGRARLASSRSAASMESRRKIELD